MKAKNVAQRGEREGRGREREGGGEGGGETERDGERPNGMAHLGVSYDHIARTFACTRATITRLTGRYRQTGETTDRARSERPRVTTSTEDLYLLFSISEIASSPWRQRHQRR